MHRAGNALQALLTQIVEYRVKTVLHILMDAAGNADAAQLGNLLKACSHIDLVAQQVIAFGDYVAEGDERAGRGGGRLPVAMAGAFAAAPHSGWSRTRAPWYKT